MEFENITSKRKKPKNTLRNVFDSSVAGTETTNASPKPLPMTSFGFLGRGLKAGRALVNLGKLTIEGTIAQ